MRVWCDVFDSDYNRLGDGPVTAIKSASFRRALDGAGTFNMSLVGTDEQALTLLTNERRVRIYGETLDGTARVLGDGIIRQRNMTEQSGGVTLQVSGPDALDELKRVNTLLARTYRDTVQNVVDALLGLATGWTATVDASIASNTIDVRYDGVSVLAALQNIADRYGYHLRLSSSTARTLDISEFGDDNGLRISKTEIVTTETIQNSELLMVQRLSQGQTSEQIYNWLLPIGAGEGTAALTLEKSTRTSPYTIQSTTAGDGRTLYYISDASSISTYGTIQKVGQFKEIAPSGNTNTDIVAAANALYDAAVEDLQRHKQQTEQYSVTVKNVQQTIQPGDKIHLDYKARVQTESGFVDYLSIRDDFWILDVNETVSASGTSATLTISNVDQRVTTPAEQMMNAIEQINLRNLQPTTTGSVRSYVYYDDMDGSNSVTVPIEFTTATLLLQRVRMRIQTRPLRSNVTAAAGGGNHSHTVTIPSHTHNVTTSDHRHLMFAQRGTITPGFITDNNWITSANDSGTSTHDLILSTTVSGITGTAELWTREEGGGETTTSASGGGSTQTSSDSGTHTHDMTYGIFDNTGVTPVGVTVSVNGTDLTNDLFGQATLAPSGGLINRVADVTELTDAIQNASGGLQQVHDIEVACTSGQGRVQVTIEVYEITQTITII
jgi:hypothetical protein